VLQSASAPAGGCTRLWGSEQEELLLGGRQLAAPATACSLGAWEFVWEATDTACLVTVWCIAPHGSTSHMWGIKTTTLVTVHHTDSSTAARRRTQRPLQMCCVAPAARPRHSPQLGLRQCLLMAGKPKAAVHAGACSTPCPRCVVTAPHHHTRPHQQAPTQASMLEKAAFAPAAPALCRVSFPQPRGPQRQHPQQPD
jgi:hypothetical protein